MVQAKKNRAVFVHDLIERGTARVGLLGAEKSHIPLGTRGNISNCDDGPNALHFAVLLTAERRASAAAALIIARAAVGCMPSWAASLRCSRQNIVADDRAEWPAPGSSEPSINPIPHSQDRAQTKGTFTQHIVWSEALITPQCHRLKNCPTHGLETVLNDDFND